MFTASSMAFAIEALGMAWPGSASHPAMTRADPRAVPAAKRRDCEQAADAVVALLKARLHCRQIITKEALENAVAMRGDVASYALAWSVVVCIAESGQEAPTFST